MNKKNLFLFMLCLVFISCIALIFIFFQENEVVSFELEENDYHEVTYQNQSYEYNSSIVSILFMGVDSTNPDSMGQADSLQLYVLNRETKSMQVINISRDTMTDIHLYDVEHNDLGYDKQHINLAYAYGLNPENGAMLTNEAVSRMLYDIPINYFAAIDLRELSSLHSVVDTLDVIVPNDSLTSLHPEWTKGSKVTLTLDTVEDFLRSRDTSIDYSNSDRMERQRAYLNAYFSKIKEMLSKDFDTTLSLLYNVSKKMTTNVTYETVETFSKMIMTYSYDSNQDFYNLPGKDRVGDNHDEFILDQEKCKKLILELFYVEGK